MSPYLRSAFSVLILVLLASLPAIDANSSGKTGSSTGGCNCHSTDAMIMPTMTGLPSTYTPGATYSVTWTGSGMSSNGEGGFNLDANGGTWSNLGTRVKAQNGELTHSSDLQRSWTADWVAPAAGTGDVTFNLAVLYANGNSQNSNDNWGTNSWTVAEGAAPSNTPPTASQLFLSPGGETPVDQPIMFSYVFDDADGDSESNSQIRWSKNGTLETAYNDQMVLPASATSVGDTWTVTVTPNDGMDLGTTETCPDDAVIVDIDSDFDGVVDSEDAFPQDATQSADQDGDGYGDNPAGTNPDAFPTDPSEWQDTDGDGYGDNTDQFDSDSTQWADQDGDGYGDNQTGNNPDALPLDSTQWADQDGDGYGDNQTGNNSDAFTADPTQWKDTDGDGYGDNLTGTNPDAFPLNPNETLDSDNDDVGDNSDAFPLNPNETLDSDNDTVGDNADAFPLNPKETLDTDGDGVGDNAQLIAENLAAEQAAEEKAAQNTMITIVLVIVLLLTGGAGAVLFIRKRKADDDAPSKEFIQQAMPTHAQQAYQQPVSVVQQPVIEQPVAVAEPTVLRQWTDETGYTWRSMDDGSNYWWTGTEWQKR